MTADEKPVLLRFRRIPGFAAFVVHEYDPTVGERVATYQDIPSEKRANLTEIAATGFQSRGSMMDRMHRPMS